MAKNSLTLEQLTEAVLHTKTVFTAPEAAKYMGIALSTLYKMTSAGIIPFSKPNNKMIYLSKENLDSWLMSKPRIGKEKREIAANTHLATHPL